MHPALNILSKIASKKERVILGLMSGTSVDGLDIALCRVTGSDKNTAFRLDHFTTTSYSPETRARLLELTSVRNLDSEELCIWHSHLAGIHVNMIREACSGWNVDFADIDLIASHGHTIYHAPIRKHGQAGKPNSTLQIGDGDHIACKTGIITISDFRQKDTARGGEGAPLAAYGDYLLFSHPQKDRVLVNLGGIANFTLLPASSETFPPLSMDTGPANTLIDKAVRTYYNGAVFDEGGQIARQGEVQQDVLQNLKNHPYFAQKPPKTTGPEMFGPEVLDAALQKAGKTDIKAEDIIATLTQLTAETVAEAILKVIDKPENTELYVSGGGSQNATMIQWLSDDLPGIPVQTTASLGLDPNAKEAVVFAVLANETLCGNGDIPTLGKISLP